MCEGGRTTPPPCPLASEEQSCISTPTHNNASADTPVSLGSFVGEAHVDR